MTNLSVVTNALLIAVTSQFIDRELFNRVYKDNAEYNSGRGGFALWATSNFSLTALLQSDTANGPTNFPVYTAQTILEFDDSGNEVCDIRAPLFRE